MTKQYGKHKRNKNPLYSVWNGIRHRCYNPKCKSYQNYGAKGVTMCNDWLNSFDNFVEWAINNGWKKGMHIDKDIKSKQLQIYPPIYSPETCLIVSPKINNLHSSNTKFDVDFIKKVSTAFKEAEDTFVHRAKVAQSFNITSQQLGQLLARRAILKLGRGTAGVLTKDIQSKIISLRADGYPFKVIAEKLQINYNTCKAWHAKILRNKT